MKKILATDKNGNKWHIFRDGGSNDKTFCINSVITSHTIICLVKTQRLFSSKYMKIILLKFEQIQFDCNLQNHLKNYEFIHNYFITNLLM